MRKSLIVIITVIMLIVILSTAYAQVLDERVKRAQVYIQSGDYQEAANILEGVVQGDPGNADVRYLLAISYRGLKQNDKAEKEFLKCISIVPDFEDAYVYLAAIQADKKEFDKAEATLDDLLKRKTNSVIGHYAKGVLYYLKQDIPRAATEFSDTIKKDDKFTSAYANLGYIYYNSGNYEEAAQNFKKAIQIENTNPEFYFAAAWIARKMGKKSEETFYLEKSSSLNPPHVYSVMAKAIKAYDEGNYQESLDRLREVFILKLDFEKGLFLEASINFNNKKYKEADTIVNRLLDKDPLDGDAKELKAKLKPFIEQPLPSQENLKPDIKK